MVPKYDYSAYNYDSWKFCEDMGFWGLHIINGKLEVDSKRFEEACIEMDFAEFIPKQFATSVDGPYHVPPVKSRKDYYSNYLQDMLDDLAKKWNKEYIPLFKKIRTPTEVRDDYESNACYENIESEYLEEISVQANIAGFKRIPIYEDIIKDIYCTFIMKICAETDRIILTAINARGYPSEDFDMESLRKYAAGCNKKIDLFKLKGFKEYNKLHQITNFLKHNSISAYKSLKQHNPQCLKKDEKQRYENGMFAGDWLNLDEADINDILSNIKIFFYEFSKKVLKEEAFRTNWNYEDYFLDAFDKLKNPAANHRAWGE